MTQEESITMKVISRIAVLVAVALVVAVSVQPANATCALARLIGGCNGTCNYITVAGSPSNVGGSFWGMGGGNPAPGLGDDNGLDTASGNADSAIDWVKQYAGNYYLGGSWGNAAVDGCVDNATTPSPKRTAVAYCGQAGGVGYALAMCQLADSGGNYSYWLGEGSSHAVPVIPKVKITGANGRTSINIGAPAVSANLLALDASCTGVITGYKVYQQIRPTAAGAPQDLNPATGGWTPAGSNLSVLPTPPCAQGSTLWVAQSLTYDSGFESCVLSAPSSVACDPTVSDRPGDFKVIKKPRAGQQRHQQN